jgi:hypothetical protein
MGGGQFRQVDLLPAAKLAGLQGAARPMKLIVTGGRDYTDRAAAFRALDKNTADFTTESQARAWLEDYHAGRAAGEIWQLVEGDKWSLVAKAYAN